MLIRDITIVLPYYCNSGMLREQQRVWRSYSADIRERVHVIVIDDGSPEAPARNVVEDAGLASFRLFRTKVDVRWNWLFCRNLGVHQTKTRWVLLTDIDHVVPESTLRELFALEHDPLRAYRFARIDAATGAPVKSHPNTWMLTTRLYDKAGGYDERLSGFYGTDNDFRSRVEGLATAIVMRTCPLVLYSRQDVADADTRRYGRKERRDGDPLAAVKVERATIPQWKPLRLTFPWERVI